MKLLHCVLFTSLLSLSSLSFSQVDPPPAYSDKTLNEQLDSKNWETSFYRALENDGTQLEYLARLLSSLRLEEMEGTSLYKRCMEKAEKCDWMVYTLLGRTWMLRKDYSSAAFYFVWAKNTLAYRYIAIFYFKGLGGYEVSLSKGLYYMSLASWDEELKEALKQYTLTEEDRTQFVKTLKNIGTSEQRNNILNFLNDSDLKDRYQLQSKHQCCVLM